jgi:hypothetical protein
LQELKRDITYAGAIVLQGIHWDYLTLNKRICISSTDGAGGSITTGLESANMILTEVEYDFTNKTTTLTFSNDLSEFYLNDLDSIKQDLNIRAIKLIPILSTAFSASGGNITQTAGTTYYEVPVL